MMSYILIAAILLLIAAAALQAIKIHDLANSFNAHYTRTMDDKTQIVAELAKHHNRLQKLEKP